MDREPTEAEVHQVEAEAMPPIEVPVRVEGPVEVRLLPAVAWTVTRYQVSDTTGPIKAVGRNPYRKRALLQSQTKGFFYGNSHEQVRTRSTAGYSEFGIPVELTHTEEIWINNVATETPDVTVNEEMWTN